MTLRAAQRVDVRAAPAFLRAILDRFRRAAGVPAPAGDQVPAELAPVFAVLDGIEVRGSAFRAEAASRIAAADAEAARQAERILADARARAETERLAAIASVRHAAAREAVALEREAEAEAERVRRTGRERMPALVAELLRCVEAGPG